MVENIKKGAEQYVSYISKNIPQTNREQTKYYFSGSLAMILLSLAKKIKPLKLDNNGFVVSDLEEKIVTEEASEAFNLGVRQISIDVDIVEVKESEFLNRDTASIYNIGAVKINCSNAVDLCPSWEKTIGTMYIDALSDEREFSSHNIAVIELENKRKILIANPIDLMFHKFSEMCVLNLEKSKDKYIKDCKDFACMFTGLCKLDMIPKDIKSYLNMMANSNNFSTINRFSNYDYSERMTKIFNDLKQVLPQENIKILENLINNAKLFNTEILQKSKA